MRTQLLTWLVDDIAPDIRRTKDAAGTIIKFATEKNLAPAIVQGLGQLYNTAKTLAFLEKTSSANRGDSFPIIDVDEMVQKYLEVGPTKSAGVADGTIDAWELDNPDGSARDLPACFTGLMTPAFVEEKVVNHVPDQSVKRAAFDREIHTAEWQMAEQMVDDTNHAISKQASEVAQALRENPEYPFHQFEADALGYFADLDDMKTTLDKVAHFCGTCRPRVDVSVRAKAATETKLLNAFEEKLMKKLASIHKDFTLLQTCREFLDELRPKVATMTADPPVEEALREWTVPVGSGSASSRGQASGESWGAPGPKLMPASKPTGDAGAGAKGPRKSGPSSSGGGGGSDLFGTLSGGLDKLLGGIKDEATPAIKSMFGGRNQDQELLDNSMRDARHIAVLQNLLTTDEILSEADPDQVVQIYNTIRETAPEIAGDINVMRVLLRSAIQHDGIAPFDLKNILETELTKQKVDFNRRLAGDAEYAGAKIPAQNRPM